MKFNAPHRRAAGFTLIELVISAAVGAMILAAAYACLSAGFATQKMIDPRVDALQSARVVMAMISADLRAACPLDNNYAFLGMHRLIDESDADNLDFATHHYTPRRDNEGDFCEISYFTQKDPRTGLLNLWRRRNPTLAVDSLSGGRRDEIVRGLKGVRFEYTDGDDWYDTWGQTNSAKKTGLIAEEQANLEGMPQAVRITLSFAPDSARRPKDAESTENPEPPLTFQTVVLLELAENLNLPAQSGAASAPSNPQSGPNAGSSAPEGVNE